MARFIYHHITPHYTNLYFGDVNVYGDGEDVKLDYESQFYCLRTKSNGDPISVRIGAIYDFSEIPYLTNHIIDFAFSAQKVEEYLYQRLCAVAASMLIAQSQKLLVSAGMASNANITIPSDHLKAASDAARQILKPGTPGASLTILSKHAQESIETFNPAIGNFENIEYSMYHGEAVN